MVDRDYFSLLSLLLHGGSSHHATYGTDLCRQYTFKDRLNLRIFPGLKIVVPTFKQSSTVCFVRVFPLAEYAFTYDDNELYTQR